MAKVLTVNSKVEIVEGKLAGTKGKLVGYDYLSNEAMVEIEENVFVTLPGGHVDNI